MGNGTFQVKGQKPPMIRDRILGPKERTGEDYSACRASSRRTAGCHLLVNNRKWREELFRMDRRMKGESVGTMGGRAL